MSTTRHMSLNIRGAILNKDYSWFSRDDGTPASLREAESFLLDRLALGERFLPIGECDNFDHQKGCLGHDDDE